MRIALALALLLNASASALASSLEEMDIGSIRGALGYVRFPDPKSGDDKGCNVFLIGKNYVVTNAHCIPNQNVCNESTFYFSDNGTQYSHSYDCKKLVATGAKTGRTPIENDFSVIELEYDKANEPSPARVLGFLPLAKLKEKHSNWTEIAIVSWSLSSLGHSEPTLKYNLCLGRLDNTKANTWDIKPNYNGNDCNLSQDDSGAALLNIEGELLGLVSGVDYDPTKSIEQFRDLKLLAIFGTSTENITKLFSDFKKYFGL